jgi:riboflavin synthase
MFTGIVTDVGEIAKVEKIKDTRAKIFCTYNVSEIELGASICCDGVCLTVTDCGVTENRNWFFVDISNETITKTVIGDKDYGWTTGRKVNLERSLKLGDELGGHIVTGHIDGTGSIEKILEVDGSTQVTFQTDASLAKFIAEKGSITLNGTSLTVNQVNASSFDINFIPHTKDNTTWRKMRVGEKVNIEIDILARYVDRILGAGK